MDDKIILIKLDNVTDEMIEQSIETSRNTLRVMMVNGEEWTLLKFNEVPESLKDKNIYDEEGARQIVKAYQEDYLSGLEG